MNKLKSGAVTDDQGRLRLHGAFTGGFSAGYFNSVGTIEGFQPSTFVSSRSNRADKVTRTAKDYMEDSDVSTDSEEELVEEMAVQSGLIENVADVGEGEVPKRSINARIAPSADFNSAEYSLLGAKTSAHNAAQKRTKKDVYNVKDIYNKGVTTFDVSDATNVSLDVVAAEDAVESNSRRRRKKPTAAAPVTSLFSSQGYSFEEGADNVYDNGADESAMYTRREVLSRERHGVHLAGAPGEDSDEDEPGDPSEHGRKQRVLGQINDNIEKWLGDKSDEHTVPKKKSRKTSKEAEFSDQSGDEGQAQRPLFVVPKKSLAAVASKQPDASESASSVRSEPRGKYGEAILAQAAAQSAPQPPPPPPSIFDLLRPQDKRKLHGLIGQADGAAPTVLSKLTDSMSTDVKNGFVAAEEPVTWEIERHPGGGDEASVEVAPTVAVTSKPVAFDVNAPPAARPMLSTGFKTDSTFAGLHEAFKNRFTSATSTAVTLQDTIVKEGMATAAEYVEVKQARENEAASQAILASVEADAAAHTGTAAPGRAARTRVKSVRTVALWAPAPLLCKRYNIKPPDITNDRAFLLEAFKKTDNIESMLDLIQKPEDTSYTVISTGADKARTRGKGKGGANADGKPREAAKPGVAVPAGATNPRAAMQGMAHLLKNRFAPSSSAAAAATTNAEQDVAVRGDKAQVETKPAREDKPAKAVALGSGGFVSEDMFSRLHDPALAAGGAESAASTAVNAAAPAPSLFKSIFEESSSGSEDEASDAQPDAPQIRAVAVPVARLPAPSSTANARHSVLDRYTSSGSTVAHVGFSVPEVKVSAETIATGPTFISRRQRELPGGTAAVDSRVVVGGAPARRGRATAADRKRSAVLSFGAEDGDDDDADEVSAALSAARPLPQSDAIVVSGAGIQSESDDEVTVPVRRRFQPGDGRMAFAPLEETRDVVAEDAAPVPRLSRPVPAPRAIDSTPQPHTAAAAPPIQTAVSESMQVDHQHYSLPAVAASSSNAQLNDEAQRALLQSLRLLPAAPAVPSNEHTRPPPREGSRFHSDRPLPSSLRAPAAVATAQPRPVTFDSTLRLLSTHLLGNDKAADEAKKRKKDKKERKHNKHRRDNKDKKGRKHKKHRRDSDDGRREQPAGSDKDSSSSSDSD